MSNKKCYIKEKGEESLQNKKQALKINNSQNFIVVEGKINNPLH